MRNKIFKVLLFVFITIIMIGSILYFTIPKNKDYKVSKEGIMYNNNGEVLGYIHNDKNPKYDVVIPEKIGKVDITTIAGGFSNSVISTLEIPNTITNISYDVFKTAQIHTVKYNGTISEWCAINLANEYSSPMHIASEIFISNGEGLKLVENKLVIPGDIKVLKTNSFYKWPCDIYELSEGVEVINEHAIVMKDEYEEIDIILPKSIKEIMVRAIVTNYMLQNVYDDKKTTNVYYSGNKDEWNNVKYVEVTDDYSNTSIIRAKKYINNNGNYELIED